MVRNLLILRILCRLSEFPPSTKPANLANPTRVDQFLKVDIIHPHGKIGNVHPVISPTLISQNTDSVFSQGSKIEHTGYGVEENCRVNGRHNQGG